MGTIKLASLLLIGYTALLALPVTAATQPWVETLKQAESNFNHSEFPAARREYEAALQEVKDSKTYLPSVQFAILRRLGEISNLGGDLKASSKYFGAALRLGTEENLATKEDLSVLATRLACVQFGIGQSDKARRTFEDWLPFRAALPPDVFYVTALSRTACSYIADGNDPAKSNVSKATKYCDMAQRVIIASGRSCQQFDVLLNHIGIFYCQSLDFKKAITALKEVRAENIMDQFAALSGQLCLIQSYLELKNTDMSNKTIAAVFRVPGILEPHSGKLDQRLIEQELSFANLLCATGQQEKGLALFDKWLPIASRNPDERYMEAKLQQTKLLAQRGKLKRADKLLSECEAKAQGFKKASTYFNLAFACFQLQHYDRAIKYLRTAKELYESQKPKDKDDAIIEIEEMIAVVYARMNRMQQASEACQIALQHILKLNYPLAKVYPEFKYLAGKRELEKGDKALGARIIKDLIGQCEATNSFPKDHLKVYRQLLASYYRSTGNQAEAARYEGSARKDQ